MGTHDDPRRPGDIAAQPKLDDIDLTDMDRFAESFPHEWFTTLRREAPVWFHEPTPEIMDGDGFWVVTKYDDVVSVSRDWQTYSSEKSPSRDGGGIMINDSPPDFGVGNMMLMMDPPKHTRYRKIVMSAFTPRVLKLFEATIKRRAAEIVDSVCERGLVRLRQRHRGRAPAPGDRRDPRRPDVGPQEAVRLDERDGRQHRPRVRGRRGRRHERAGRDVHLRQRSRSRRSAPRPTDDIVTAILNAEVDGERLDELEFDLFFMLLTVAGNETTRNAISHGMLAFFENPDQWKRLHARPFADVDRGRRGRALGQPGHLLPPLGHAGHRAARVRRSKRATR